MGPRVTRFSGVIRDYRERKCADTIGTLLVPWAGRFQCYNVNLFFKQDRLHESNCIKQYSETVTVRNYQNADCTF